MALSGGYWTPEIASDGEPYYEVLDLAPALLSAYVKLNRLGAKYRQLAGIIRDVNARRDAEVRAAVVDRITATLSRGADTVAVHTASFATSDIRAKLDSRLVRPQNTGELRHSIYCNAIKARAAGTLEVGIGKVTALESGPSAEYWLAQELGSRHLLGKKLYGYFQPGNVPADPTQNRAHPVFEPTKSGKRMIVRHAIQPKHFLRDGTVDALAFRNREFAVVETEALRELALVSTGKHPSMASIARAIARKRI